MAIRDGRASSGDDASYLDPAHPLLPLELFPVLQPVDGRRRVAGCRAAELDGVGRRDGQELLVHPIRPGPIRRFCWREPEQDVASVRRTQSPVRA